MVAWTAGGNCFTSRVGAGCAWSTGWDTVSSAPKAAEAQHRTAAATVGWRRVFMRDLLEVDKSTLVSPVRHGDGGHADSGLTACHARVGAHRCTPPDASSSRGTSSLCPLCRLGYVPARP